jgi:hypothetical protein
VPLVTSDVLLVEDTELEPVDVEVEDEVLVAVDGDVDDRELESIDV